MMFRWLFDALEPGPPRGLFLRVFGWKVGDARDEQVAAALLVSMGLALVTIFIYSLSARACCNNFRRRRAVRAVLGLPDPSPTNLYWTVHNRRYDLKAFVPLHPGGSDAIMLGQGRNCTELFESYHSLANQKLVLMKLSWYFVEEVPPGAIDYDTRFKWHATPFYDTLKSRVRNHFEMKHGGVCAGYHADLWQWMQIVVFVFASGLALRGFMRGEKLSMLLLPFCYWWGPSPCMHDGGHFSLSRRPWINLWCAHIGGAHMSLFAWQHQHTIGHHTYTNLAGKDPDLYHFSIGVDTGTAGFRTSIETRTLPERTWNGLPRWLWWRIGVLLRIPMTTFGPSVLWDALSLFTADLEHGFLGIVPYPELSVTGLVSHSVGRSLVIWLAIIHPIVVCLLRADGWYSGACNAGSFVTVPYCVHGCLFYMFSQISHIQHECFKVHVNQDDQELWHHSHPFDKIKFGLQGLFGSPRPPRAPIASVESSRRQWIVQHGLSSESEWAVHQVESTMDYAVNSRFWSHVSNGLNLQVVHHLFPQVGWGHYRELSPIIEEVCAEFGVKYAVKSSFGAALVSHFKYLNRVNTEPQASVWVHPPKGQGEYKNVLLWNNLDQVDEFISEQSGCDDETGSLIHKPAVTSVEKFCDK